VDKSFLSEKKTFQVGRKPGWLFLKGKNVEISAGRR
jgi:hypothetical protein